MTNLLLLYPDIPQSATAWKTYTNSTSESPYEDEDMPFHNSIRGERYQFWRSDTTTSKSEHNAVLDLGPNTTKAVNFVVLSRLDILASLSASTTIDFKLQSSSDDSTYTDRHTITDVSTATLKGPWSNDYVSTFTATSAFRYWRAKFVKSAGSDFNLKIGKVYFGTSLDLGNDPDIDLVRKKGAPAPYITSGGVVYLGKVNHPTYEITLRWEGISDDKAQDFYEEIVRKRHNTSFFLHTTTYNHILDGHEIINVKMIDVDIVKEYQDWNRITATCIEVHG